MEELTLEISLKPFLREKTESYESVAMELFRQWQPMAFNAEKVSVLLWTADGSEILEFSGDLEQKFDWCRYVGIINKKQTSEQKREDPDRRHATATGKVFEENTDMISYRVLKDIVDCLKRVAKDFWGLDISVGNTFDPGPEFAVSKFKYETHPEICLGGFVEGVMDVVSCYSRLNADNEVYASFPDGIPEGTSFGSFLGRQSVAFLQAMDMDFIWLSNGFGFGNFAWCFPGVIFDDTKFMPGKAEEVRAQMIEFWTEFRKFCTVPVMVRGANLSAGRDLAADGVPLREIYEIGKLVAPPVNSPWGALNKDFGAELCGWMSHAAGFPGDEMMFRYYVNDPWFQTKPYLLNYQKQPYDIYLPLAVSRINSEGRVVTPSHVNILTVDDCKGELPREATESLTPHINQALNDVPDTPGPLVWLYPFDEYHDWTFKSPSRIDEIFAGDLFIRDAINNGLPLNTVVSTNDCRELPAGRVVLSPVPQANSRWEDLLMSYLNNSGNVMLYGSLEHASDTLFDLLGIKTTEALDGEFNIVGDYLPEFFEGKARICHNSIYSAGGIRECAGNTILAKVSSEQGTRTVAAEAQVGRGRLVWLRTSVFRCHAFSVADEYDDVIERGRYIEPAAMMVMLLKRFGWNFEYRRQTNRGWNPVNAVSMNNNAFFFSGYNFTTTTEHRLQTPFGAPALLGQDFILENSTASYHFDRSYHYECRVLIDQQDKSLVSCYETTPKLRDVERWIWVRNVNDALLRIFIPADREKTLEVQVVTSDRNYTTPPHPIKFKQVRTHDLVWYELTERVSGQILIFW